MTELDRRQQHPVQCEEHGDLHQDREATAERVDLLGPVHLHHFHLQLLLVVRVLLLQCLELGPDHLHLRHRACAGVIERVEHALDDDGEQDDRPTPIVHEAIEPFEQPEQRCGNDREDSIIDH